MVAGRKVQGGGDICIHMADSLCCIAETNTTLNSSYTPIQNKRIHSKLRQLFKWNLVI